MNRFLLKWQYLAWTLAFLAWVYTLNELANGQLSLKWFTEREFDYEGYASAIQMAKASATISFLLASLWACVRIRCQLGLPSYIGAKCHQIESNPWTKECRLEQVTFESIALIVLAPLLVHMVGMFILNGVPTACGC